jgi:S-adenosylmethionine/arginine decarboxylase-like enzyme
VKPSAHLHLLINAHIKNPPGPNDCDRINDIMRGLVEHVRMNVMIEPVSAWCNDIGNEGITSTVILTTSHCAMHIWNFPEPHLSIMQFDLYSCAPFEVNEVIKYLATHFYIQEASYKFLDRESGFTDISNGSYRKVV